MNSNIFNRRRCLLLVAFFFFSVSLLYLRSVGRMISDKPLMSEV